MLSIADLRIAVIEWGYVNLTLTQYSKKTNNCKIRQCFLQIKFY